MTKHHAKRSSRRRHSLRAFITYLVALSFLVMLTSGLVNFLAPSGRVSRQVGWTLFGLDRAGWQSLHLSFAVIFVAAGLVHVAYNWKGLLHYLLDRASHHLTLKWEAVAALLVTLWLIASAVLALPPASNLHDLNAHFRQTFWTGEVPAGGAVRVPSAGPTEEIPASADGALPQKHPAVPADKACSDCHRGQ